MTEEQRNYSLLNRIVLAYCFQWGNQHGEKMKVPMPDIAYQIKAAGFASKAINGFSDEERERMRNIAEEPKHKELEKVEISLVIMLLQVMKLHVESVPKEFRTPKLNISDKRLIKGKANYALYMLEAKQKDKEGYDIQKEIIDATCDHAVNWYTFMYEQIVGSVLKVS